jgi:hypothetical protein
VFPVQEGISWNRDILKKREYLLKYLAGNTVFGGRDSFQIGNISGQGFPSRK